MIRNFDTEYDLIDGESKRITARAKNVGRKPWVGAFIAPQFPSGVYMPVDPCQPGEEIDI
jgi:hypothetical protein